MTSTTASAIRQDQDRPTRSQLIEMLSDVMADSSTSPGARFGWQGALDAASVWQADTGPSDLDIWANHKGAAAIDKLMRGLPAARVQFSSDPQRLQHTSYAVETDAGLAVVDVTRGDLMVGPVLLCREADVAVVDSPTGPRLAGSAAVADLVVRKLLRGGTPPPDRLNQAREQWAAMSAGERQAAADLWARGIGGNLAGQISLLLVDRTRTPTADLARRVRARLLAASLKPTNLRSTWRARDVVRPAGRQAGPLGLRTRGVVVALVGTDGSGKSTVAHDLSDRLVRSGFEVASPYFGMARGNLPGVNLARKIMGVAIEPESAQKAVESPAEDGAEPRAVAEVSSVEEPVATELSHAQIRKVAAWYYAGEYVIKWLRSVAPALATRKIVIADRYIYDLRDSPWPGSSASKALQALLPPPDFLVLPDAPDELIHARKPERPAWEQAAQQQRFRDLVSEQLARRGSIRTDSSGATPDPLAGLVAEIVEAAHLRPGFDSP